jgi:NAD(P)H dehydrogenase (quinone)
MTTTTQPRLFVTGAAGQLGRFVIDALLKRAPAGAIVAGVRSVDGDAAKDLRARGIEVRAADYDRPELLASAFNGIGRLLLISASEVGVRVGQHRNVIDAAKRAGVGLIAYTSLLRADTSPLALAEDHRRTEAALGASGLPFVLLRNSWYTENYAASIKPALAHGVFLGCAQNGRIASATRGDYAEAAAVVLTTDNHAGLIYELAGDEGYTLTEFAAAVAAEAARPVVYRDLPEAEFEAALLKAGLPGELAGILANSDAGVAQGGLDDGGRQLSVLIGRPTTPYQAVIRQALSTS